MNKDISNFLKEDSERCQIGIKTVNGINYPIIACWRIDLFHVGFWCSECQKIHLHGWGNGNPNGHRAAHCGNEKSKFKTTGYFLNCQADLTNPLTLNKYLNEGLD